MRITTGHVLAGIFWAALIHAPVRANTGSQGQIIPIPPLPGGNKAFVYGLSPDGSTVLGSSPSTNTAPGSSEAFAWTKAGGTAGLGDLAGDGFNSFATSSSLQGSVITGLGSPSGNAAAFKWTQATGMTPLPLPAGFAGGGAVGYGVSADGSTIVGSVGLGNGSGQAVRWTSTGAQALGLLDSSHDIYAEGRGVSADGSVVVGFEDKPNNKSTAFRWTQSGGLQALDDIVDGLSQAQALGISPDGAWVLGTAMGPAGLEPVRWDAAGHAQVLGGGLGLAKSSTANGSIIVGNVPGGSEAFIWDGLHGYRDLNVAILQDWGITTDFANVGAISSDGFAIAGNDASGSGFLVILPEPSWHWNLAAALMALCLFRHRKQNFKLR